MLKLAIKIWVEVLVFRGGCVMYRLVVGERSFSLVGCILQPFSDVARIYLGNAPAELVHKRARVDSWRVAQLYLQIDHSVGFKIMPAGLLGQVSHLYLEVDNGHYPLWSREDEESSGRRQVWPMVEINFGQPVTASQPFSQDVIRSIFPRLE
jgi:hypothetical protein